MKTIILSIFLVTLCLFVETQGVCRDLNGRELSVGTHHIDCLTYTCNPDGSISAVGCPTYLCREGKQIGYHETDLSKPFPECCEGPICAD